MRPKPRTICRDGASLSIQTGPGLYCHPRDDIGPYFAVEVGYIRDADGEPLTPPESWRVYADGEFPSNVYGYVPIWAVEDFIASHGGKI